MNETKIKVGITHGDPNGIGYEVILKSLCDPAVNELFTPVIYGSAQAAGFYRSSIPGLDGVSLNQVSSARDARTKQVNLVNCCDEEFRVEPGKPSAHAAKLAVTALQEAVQDLNNGIIDVLATAPINKEKAQEAGLGFTGHTEFLAHHLDGHGQPLMMMCSELLKVGLATIHIPVSAVSSSLSRDSIVDTLHRLRHTLIQDFSIHEPRLAVLALNPHAGDGGLIGNEEKEIILPAIQQAMQQKILAFGPFPADGFFAAAGYRKYDAVLAMYHDQGLAPFKALSDDGVNFTAGLSAVRTSPAHGVGYDIAGQGVADPSAMREAIFMAIDIFRSRKLYEEISANPLQKYKRETGADVSVSDLPEQSHAD